MELRFIQKMSWEDDEVIARLNDWFYRTHYAGKLNISVVKLLAALGLSSAQNTIDPPYDITASFRPGGLLVSNTIIPGFSSKITTLMLDQAIELIHIHWPGRETGVAIASGLFTAVLTTAKRFLIISNTIPTPQREISARAIIERLHAMMRPLMVLNKHPFSSSYRLFVDALITVITATETLVITKADLTEDFEVPPAPIPELWETDALFAYLNMIRAVYPQDHQIMLPMILRSILLRAAPFILNWPGQELD